MANDPTQAWLNNAGRYPLLPKAEVLRLAKKRDTYEPGSKGYVRIVNKICEHNLRLVPGVVRKYTQRRIDLKMSNDVVADLLQQGYLGLRRAAELFDGTRGFSFTTYCYPWIYQSVSRWHNGRDRPIYIPESSMRELLYRNKHGHPSDGKSGRMADDIIRAAARSLNVTSIDRTAPSNDDSDVALIEIMSDENRILSNISVENEAAKRKLTDLMVECEIHPMIQDIVNGYTHRGRMSVVAAKLAMNPKRCQTLYNQAVRTMQERVKRKSLNCESN